MRRISSAALVPLSLACSARFVLLTSLTSLALAQETGTVTGTVTRAAEGSAAEQRLGHGRGHRAEHRHRRRRQVHAPAGPGRARSGSSSAGSATARPRWT